MDADVVLQAGHEGQVRNSGPSGTAPSHGASGATRPEHQMTPIVADAAAAILTAHGVDVIRVPALFPQKYSVRLGLALHFDGSGTKCASGASVGYPPGKPRGSNKPTADLWKEKRLRPDGLLLIRARGRQSEWSVDRTRRGFQRRRRRASGRPRSCVDRSCRRPLSLDEERPDLCVASLGSLHVDHVPHAGDHNELRMSDPGVDRLPHRCGGADVQFAVEQQRWHVHLRERASKVRFRKGLQRRALE